MPCDLVIFDMDDVLAHLDRRRRLDSLADITGKHRDFIQEKIWASDFETAAEAGAYPTGEEYLAEFNRRIGCKVTRAQWVRARRDAMTVWPEVVQIAEALSERTTIALLTNNGALLSEALGEILPDVARVFGSHAHASFEFRARKPERQVFERILARYQVSPQRAMFIDDEERSVESAKQLGIDAIRFTGAGELREQLRQRGLLVT